jgi:hypothetical protein
MLITKMTAFIFAFTLILSTELTAAELKGNTCTLGLLPFGNTMINETQKNEIIEAYEKKGFYVSLLSSPSQLLDVEFISDATVECTSTYFGTMAETTVRIIEPASNIIKARSVSPKVMDLFNCKVEVVKAVAGLPNCSVK